MILKDIRLVNYRKFRNQFIEFPEGIMGVVGKNGAGKSTIFEAIGWALYGNVMSRSDKEEIKSQNAQENDTCCVELEFNLGEHNYKILRELRGSILISTASVFVDGSSEPEAVRDSSVNKYIENLLGMDYVTFMRSVYAKQKDLASLSTLTRAERQKVIRRMLNVDRIDSALDSIRADKRGKEDYIKGIRIALVDIDKLKEQRKDIVKKMKAIKKNISELGVKKDKLSEEKETAAKLKEEQENLYRQYNELKNAISRSTSRLEELRKRNDSLLKEKEKLQKENELLIKLSPREARYLDAKAKKEHMDDLRIKHERKSDLKKSTAEILEDIKERGESISDIKQRLMPFRDIERQYRIVQKQLKEAKQREKEVNRQKDRNIKEISICKNKIDELLESKKDITKLGPEGKCPNCYRKLGESYGEIIHHLEEEINALKLKYQSLKNQDLEIQKQRKEIADLENKLEATKGNLNTKINQKYTLEGKLKIQKQELLKTKNRFVKEKAELRSLAKVKFSDLQYGRIKKELESLSEERDRIISLRREVSRLPTITQELKDNQATIKQEEDILNKNQRATANLKFDLNEYNRAKKHFEEISERLSAARVNLEKEESNWKIKTHEFNTVRSKIREQRDYRKQIEKTETDIQYLACLETIMIDFRSELINRIRPLLVFRASDLFRELTDDRYPLIDLDDDYNIYIVDGNQPYNLKRFSGGEEDLANLCLRIAMSQIIAERSGAQEVKFMALDEIFGSQDEDRRKNILNAFNKLSSQFRQIILITHIQSVREMLPCVLKVEEDSRKESHAEFE